ncbi:MAG: SDR family NAD(P)-dependent oxidoreductase [Gammaproteobacteria bacterium]|nr:SDR family NAD(P)-dependent oxidoreductase [Gammaproteobacteria bacterium]
MAKFSSERVALVTGGSRGIGRATALALGKAGMKVAVNYHRDSNAALQTVAEIQSNKGDAKAFFASVADVNGCEKLVSSVKKEFGTPTVLICNAGIASRGLSVAETSEQEITKLFTTHTLSAHVLCRLLISDMRTAKRADIVMISCANARKNIANGAPYNMAKAALEALAMTLAKEEREHGIRVNVVVPGLVRTEMGKRLMRARAGIMNIGDLDDSSPFEHVCDPDEVGNVVKFLVSEENTYMTGTRIVCDGGGTIDNNWY